LAEVSARLAEIQNDSTCVPENAPVAVPEGARTVRPPLVGGSSYPEVRNAIISGSEARLRVSKDAEVRSPTGVMVSDLEQKMIVGDLAVETPKGTLRADGAVFDARSRVMTAERMTFSSKKEPSQALEPTRTPVTDRAAHAPRQP
jgi:hypothetical protein